MATYHFNLDEVSCIAMGIPITEYAQGDAVVVELREDDWVESQGHHGSVIRSLKPNNIADAKLLVMPGSPVNDLLSARAELDIRTGLGVGVFQLKDLNGTTMASAAVSWCKKRAPVKCATEPGAVEWPITLAENVKLWPGSNRFLVPTS